MASVKQVRGKESLMEVLLKKNVIDELKERGVETLGLSDDGIVYKVEGNRHIDGNCLTISITAKSENYDGDRAVAYYKERIKLKIKALKNELDFYENLGI